MNVITRVDATQAALELIARLLAKHGALMFHQSGGCCDGSSPMCYPVGELLVGASDVKLGDIGGARPALVSLRNLASLRVGTPHARTGGAPPIIEP